MSPTEGYVATCAGMVYQRSCCGLQEALFQNFLKKTFCHPAFPKNSGTKWSNSDFLI